MSSGSIAATSPPATAAMALPSRHTPFGAPVVPDVKVIFDVPAGIGTGRDGRLTMASD